MTLEQENRRLREALSFYAWQWESELDAELTASGWVGEVGVVIPTADLLNDEGRLARSLLAALPEAPARCEGEGLREALEKIAVWAMPDGPERDSYDDYELGVHDGRSDAGDIARAALRPATDAGGAR